MGAEPVNLSGDQLDAKQVWLHTVPSKPSWSVQLDVWMYRNGDIHLRFEASKGVPGQLSRSVTAHC